jgi:hypothetical protein
MESLLEQFSGRCPVAVMARQGLQRAVGAEWVEAVFAEHRGMQYTRELAFSTVVDLVAVGLHLLGRGRHGGCGVPLPGVEAQRRPEDAANGRVDRVGRGRRSRVR